MEPFTLNRDLQKQDIFDSFSSIIWTERYYGDGDVEMVLPVSLEAIQKLAVGTFIGLDQSDEIMILQTMNIEGNKIKVTGISLLPWLNNRFIRNTAKHEDKFWSWSGNKAGQILWGIIYYMCVAGSPYLTGATPTGIANPEKLAVPGLGVLAQDGSGSNLTIGIPFGPVYDALKEIATTYEIGMQIVLVPTDAYYPLQFRSYKGVDRSSSQSVNPVVRFSPDTESFGNIKELQSIADFKTLVYTFAPGLNPAEGETDLRGAPGVASLPGSDHTGFDLRAMMVFADDITTDLVGSSAPTLLSILNSRAADALADKKMIKAVDGEIVPGNQFIYGDDYNLGDIIEVEGNSGTIQSARITEYIRSQDESGEKAYPTVAIID